MQEKSNEGGWNYIATAIQSGTAGNEALPTISLLFGGRKNGRISMYDVRDYGTPIYEIDVGYQFLMMLIKIAKE